MENLNAQSHFRKAVLLAYDHPIVRAGFPVSLAPHNIKATGQAKTPAVAVSVDAAPNPDVLVLHVRRSEQLSSS